MFWSSYDSEEESPKDKNPAGEVSFYDVDGMAHIYTYKDTITEKLFPYLHIGEPGSIKVCQTDISPIVRKIFVVVSVSCFCVLYALMTSVLNCMFIHYMDCIKHI